MLGNPDATGLHPPPFHLMGTVLDEYSVTLHVHQHGPHLQKENVSGPRETLTSFFLRIFDVFEACQADVDASVFFMLMLPIFLRFVYFCSMF